MGWISIVFVRKVIGFATEGEPDRAALRDELLRSVGLDADAPPDPIQMVRDVDFFGLLERVGREDHRGHSIPVRVGASMRCDDYGAFGLAFKSAVDLEGSYLRVERYGRVVTSIANFEVVPGKTTSLMKVIAGRDPRPGLWMTNELALAAAMALSREVSRHDFTPVAAHVSHEPPADPSQFDQHFRCPVHFGSAFDALEVSHERLRSPNRLGDAGISGFFDRHLDQALAELPEDAGLGRRVRAEITQTLCDGVPTLSRMAKRLGMSGRTLQRRLAASGLAYQALVEDARRELAQQLLRTSDYSLAEIAFLTGFSEQSTFGRAFKRWSGATPRAYRMAAR